MTLQSRALGGGVFRDGVLGNGRSNARVGWLGASWLGASWAGAVFAGVLLSACASDAPLELERSAGEQKPETGNDDAVGEGAAPNETDSQAPGALDPWALAEQAPGYQLEAYPAGPYGLGQGAVIENLSFLGWSDPIAAGYRMDRAETVSLSDFYDPAGDKGIELLLINAVAVWCGVCRVEYQDLQTSQIYAGLRERGLRMLGILFEDNDNKPARYVDLVNWGATFEVNFPLVLDPGFKTGVYFDRSATPMNMLVDARTMQILVVMTGYDPKLYELAAQELTNRGR